MKNTFGNNISLTLFGESHGAAVGAVLDGLAAGCPVDEAFLAACDRGRIEGFAPLFEGSGTTALAARAALLPNTFLQALVFRALTDPALPEVTTQ